MVNNILKSFKIPSSDLFQIRILVNVVLFLTVINCVIFGLDSFHEGNILYVIIDFSFALIAIINIVILFVRPSYLSIAQFISIGILWILFYILASLGGQSFTGFLWSFTFPVAAFFIIGLYYGSIAVALYIIAISLTLFLPETMLPWVAAYSGKLKIRYVDSLILVSIASFLYEYSRSRKQQTLSKQNIMLEIALADIKANQEQLRFLSTNIVSLMALKSQSEIFDYIGTCLIRLIPDAVVLVGVLQGDRVLSLQGIYGVNEPDLEKIMSKVGVALSEVSIEIDEPLYNAFLEKTLFDFRTMYTKNDAAEPVSQIINLLCVHSGCEKVHSIGLTFGEKLYGCVTLFLKKGCEVKNPECIEIFISQVSVAIQRKMVEDSLAMQTLFQDALFEAIPNPIFYKDEKLRFLGCNKAFEKMFNCEISEIKGKTVEDIWPVKMAQKCREKDNELIETHIVQIYEWTINSRYGTTHDVVFSNALFRKSDGSSGGIIGTVLDITDIKKAKVAAERANKTKTQFLANMSHEIRTPLNGVIGMTELLLTSDLTIEQQEFAETIKNCADSLLSLLNDMLDLSKIEAGKISLEIQPFGLEQLLESVHSIMTFQSRQKGIDYNTHIDSDVPRSLKGDSGRLRQMLLNLVGNAIKFTLHGEVRLNVKVESLVKNLVRLKIEISDTGIGIPGDKIDLLFQPFTQVDQSENRRFGGTGLGLSISKKLAELMNGTIVVSSQKNTGSTFTLFVECQILESNLIPESTDNKEEVDDTEKIFNPYKILLIEDNPVNLRVTTLILEKLGLSVEYAEDGILGLHKLTYGVFDLVLMDLHMPRMDGFRTIEEIRAGNAGEKNRTLPVLALTAAVLKDELDRCLQSGFNGYILKPVLIDELYKRLSAYLKKKENYGKNVDVNMKPDVDSNHQEPLIFDERVALVNMADDRDLLRDALHLFSETARGYLKNIADATNDRNLTLIGAHAHTLKGSSYTVGAMALGSICEKMEKAAKAGDNNAFAMSNDLEETARQFINHIEKL